MANRMRVARIRAVLGVWGAATKVRASRFALVAAASGFTAGTSQTVLPGAVVLMVFSGADSYTVTQTSGPSVTVTVTGASAEFRAPRAAAWQGRVMVFHVIGTTGGTQQAGDVTVTALPVQVWKATAINGGVVTWTPSVIAPLT